MRAGSTSATPLLLRSSARPPSRRTCWDDAGCLRLRRCCAWRTDEALLRSAIGVRVVFGPSFRPPLPSPACGGAEGGGFWAEAGVLVHPLRYRRPLGKLCPPRE